MGPGTRIGGKYVLASLLGEGGMGSVWRANHEHLERPVAIKLIKPEVADNAELVARFLREARTAAAVRHRNVIVVLDFGQLEDGRPYLVMELLEGESLSSRLRRSPRPTIPEICDIAISSLSGLAAVHDAGIIHRDLKPDNIFLSRDADGVVPKIVDFGISKPMSVADSVARPATALTASGAIIGTAHYLSPEQVQGRRDIDARSDVYAMGALLYEAISGRLPFDEETLGALMLAIITSDPPPLASLRRDVPASVAAIVHRALARDRAQRFATAREMREALSAALGLSAPGREAPIALAATHAGVARPTPLSTESERYEVPRPSRAPVVAASIAIAALASIAAAVMFAGNGPTASGAAASGLAGGGAAQVADTPAEGGADAGPATIAPAIVATRTTADATIETRTTPTITASPTSSATTVSTPTPASPSVAASAATTSRATHRIASSAARGARDHHAPAPPPHAERPRSSDPLIADPGF
jgi:tRNA A-37 threonylcarbamoyl transferase component Bud32